MKLSSIFWHFESILPLSKVETSLDSNDSLDALERELAINQLEGFTMFNNLHGGKEVYLSKSWSSFLYPTAWERGEETSRAGRGWKCAGYVQQRVLDYNNNDNDINNDINDNDEKKQ